MKKATGLALVQTSERDKLTLQEMIELATQLGDAGDFVPQHFRTKGQVLAAIMTGQELGLGPMASLRGLHSIRGKVGMNYEVMIGLLKRAGYRVEWLVKTATSAQLKLTAPDGTEHVEVFDKARAEAAKLMDGEMYKKYPEAMLTARCVSSACRAFAGEVLSGCYVEGELEEAERVDSRVEELTTAQDGMNENYGAEQVTEAYRLQGHSKQTSDDLYKQAHWGPKLDKWVTKLEEVAEKAAVCTDDAKSATIASFMERATVQVQQWCHVHGADYYAMHTNARGNTWRRLLKCETALALPPDTVKGWLREGREEPADPEAVEGEIIEAPMPADRREVRGDEDMQSEGEYR